MTRRVFLSIAIALSVLSLVGADDSTSVSLTDGSFDEAAGLIFDASVDNDTWATYTNAYYGPGKTNETVIAYGWIYTSPDLTGIGSRRLNATLLANGTKATVAADVTISTTDVKTLDISTTNIQKAVGFGSMALAYVAEDGDGVEQVYLSVWDGDAGSFIFEDKQLTDNTAVTCNSTTAGVSFKSVVHNVFFDNGTYFVAYSTETATEDKTNCNGTLTGTTLETMLQGYANTSSATEFWNASVTLLSEDSITDYGADTMGVMCSPSTLDEETYWCTYYNNGDATDAMVYYLTVNTTAGTATSGTKIATNDESTADSITTTTTYTVAGFVHSLFQQGIILNEAVKDTDGTDTNYTNTLIIWNLTEGATASLDNAIDGYSNDVNGGAYGGSGINYGESGYLLLDQYESDADTSKYDFGYHSYLGNGTANASSRSSVGTTTEGATGNFFLDSEGALWFGAYTYDDTTTFLLEGHLGQVKTETYNASNALATVFALLSIMIAALFAF